MLGERYSKTVTTTPYNIDPVYDDYIAVGTGASVLNLPAGVAGKQFILSDEGLGAFNNNLTINADTANGDTIEGGSAYVFNLDGELSEIIYNPTSKNWSVTSAPLPPEMASLFLTGPAMGLESGGVLTSGGGFVVDVASGTGFFANGVPVQKFTWSATSITLSANVNNYIYFNNNQILTANASFPDTTQNILLGRVVTNSSGIDFIDATPMTMTHYGNLNDNMVRQAFGAVYDAGSIVTENVTPLKLNVSAGNFYYGSNGFSPSGGSGLAFKTYYQNGSGGWIEGSASTVDNANWDPGTGTLSALTAGYYAKHALYVVGSGANEQYLFVYSQVQYQKLVTAETGPVPTPPSFFSGSVVCIAAIIVQQGATSLASGGEIQDARPTLTYKAPSQTAVTVHANLLGLSSDDHTQYLLVNGTRAMSGNLNLGSNNINSVATLNATTVAATTANLTNANLTNVLSLTQTTTPSAPATAVIDIYPTLTNTLTRLRAMDSTGLVMSFFRDNFFIVYNNTGSTINKGVPVYFNGTFSGTSGYLPTIALAQANVGSTTAQGITAENIANGGYGRVQFSGSVGSINLSGFSMGASVYLSATSAGVLTSTAPTAPNITQLLGFVVNNSTTGTLEILVKASSGSSSGSASSNFQLGPGSGSSAVVLGFANANLASLSWNPTANFTLALPATQGGSNTILQNDGAGNLSWQTSPSVMTSNYDGGSSSSVYTSAIVVDGGTS
jgi:hypothetical protein